MFLDEPAPQSKPIEPKADIKEIELLFEVPAVLVAENLQTQPGQEPVYVNPFVNPASTGGNESAVTQPFHTIAEASTMLLRNINFEMPKLLTP